MKGEVGKVRPSGPSMRLHFGWTRVGRRTGPDGEFTVRVLEPGPWIVAVGRPPDWAYRATEAIAVVAGRETEVTVLATPPPPDRLVRGRVLRSDGMPLGGAMVGCVAIWLPNVYGVGYTTISPALAGSLPWALMAMLVVAKIFATSVTIGSGGSAGRLDQRPRVT